ncbi:MAG: ferritin family protein [Verrucomicrobia bacterium]|nr:ferritin family protein [Verrucomicrobiota bacterium]
MTVGGHNAHEHLAIAREMEEEGLAFYKAVAKQVADPDAKAMFLKLASDETQHIRDIDQLATQCDTAYIEDPDGLVGQYLRGLVDTSVFPPLSEVPAVAAPATGVGRAIDIGIGAEKRAMEFYLRTKDECGSAEAANVLSRLYAQEEQHLKALNALRRNYP